jgi:DHA1 family bicyclomycin/chloramphenicol resistance-like MFS transporter
MMAGLFAVFSATPRVLLEHFGFSPVALGLLFAGVVLLVFGASMLAPRLSAWLGLYRATLVGLGATVIGAAALLLAVLIANDWFLPFLLTEAIFVFGLGIVSPLSSAAALSPFANKAGVAAALFGFAQMAGAACGALLAAVLASDPALGLGIVLALASPLAMILHGRDGRLPEQMPQPAEELFAARNSNVIQPGASPGERPSSRLDAPSLILIAVISCVCVLASLWAALPGADPGASLF